MAREKENPERVGSGLRGIDLAHRPITYEIKRSRREAQPVALPLRFGICAAVFVRADGAEQRLGLYGDTGAARAAAESLNQIFRAGSTP